MIRGVSYEKSFIPTLQFVAEPTANGHFEFDWLTTIDRLTTDD